MENKIFSVYDGVARTWLNNCDTVEQAIQKAIKKEYGFIVVYDETGDPNHPWILKFLGWKFHWLDYSTAIELVPKDEPGRFFYEEAHRRNPEIRLLAAVTPEGPLVFLPWEFEKIEELPLAEYQKILAEV